MPTKASILKRLRAMERRDEASIDMLVRYVSGQSPNVMNVDGGGSDPTLFDITMAVSDIATELKRHAVCAWLVDDPNWGIVWSRYVAHMYWGCRFEMLHYEINGLSSIQKNGMMSLRYTVGHTVANLLVLGWIEKSLSLARRALIARDKQWFFDSGCGEIPCRTQHFVLNLLCSWQRWEAPKNLTCTEDEPLFNSLLSEWRSSDKENLKTLLLSVLDRHTFQTLPDSSKNGFLDCRMDETIYNPFEVLAVLKLRKIHELENPDLNEHILMQSLAASELPADIPEPWDDLLVKIVERAGRDFPGLLVA